MRNKFLIIIKSFLFTFFFNFLLADDLFIQSEKINIDKKKEVTIFKDNVIFKTQDNKTIQSGYAEYNKKKNLIILKDRVILIDQNNNRIETEFAEYFENKKQFSSKGSTRIITREGYTLEGKNVNLNKDIASSEEQTIITDLDKNSIYLENFEFSNKDNIFKSIGYIKIKDKLKNIYEFSQIYIDTKNKEILGTDIKAFINDERLKADPKNKPRIFANTININKQKSTYNKSIFTLCDYRKNDKCPPWTIQSSKMLHDNKKKTIYYDHALLKVYNIPVFYFPKLSHPDPSVKRRSGFLPPLISDTKNLGPSISVPYFFAINEDKNFTLTNRFFERENPLFLGEYHQVFKNSELYADFGYTDGYKETSASKKPGQKSHFFSKFAKNFKGKNGSDHSLEINTQEVSNDKYLKLYKIDSNLMNYNEDVLENSIDYSYSSDNLFLGINSTMYETLKSSYDDKYEYILPEAFLTTNLLNNEMGSLDLNANLKFRNYDTNKNTKFLVNDFIFKSKDISFNSGITSQILGNFKNINYEVKNVDIYKNDFTTEIYGALGLLSELKLEKTTNNSKHFLTPKFLLRYAPGSMRKSTGGTRLDPLKAFNINKVDDVNNFETGLNGTIGFDYKIKNENKVFDFSVAQVINEMENKKMTSLSSLDEKLSDVVGSTSYKLNDKITLNYDFALDQNYNETNLDDFGITFNADKMKFDFNYLKEDKHIGEQKYFNTEVDFYATKNNLISFGTKRDLIKNSAEYYNLSYEYFNDCLRAGLVYRREFYNDSELEPENSLMFKITITPFGNIDSPTFTK